MIVINYYLMNNFLHYEYTQKPWNVEWDPETNEIVLI